MRNLIVGLLAVIQAAAADAAPFTDADLTRELRESPAGLIYAWSPAMPYSYLGAVEAAAVARQLNLRFIPLVDPYQPYSETSIGEDPDGLATHTLESTILMQMGMFDHFPSMVVFRDGKFVSPVFPGYSFPTDLEDYLEERLR